jgi:peroxiredoxin
MRLIPGATAPEFSADTIRGERLTLAGLRGSDVLLKFYRFAECPICNLHLREFVRRHEEVAAAGLTVIVLFHSAESRLERTQGVDLPFHLVADPDKQIFGAYGIEEALRGMFAGRVARDYGRAMAAGHFSRPFGYHGGIKGLPADFLIDRDGVIRLAHYGENYADSLDVDQVLAAAAGLAAPLPGTRRGLGASNG